MCAHIQTSNTSKTHKKTTLVGGTLLKVQVVATFWPTAYLSVGDHSECDDCDEPARLIIRLLFGSDKLNQSTNSETAMLSTSGVFNIFSLFCLN